LDTSKLKTFAQNARRDLIEQVKLKVDSVLLLDSAARRESPKAVASLEAEIKTLGVEQATENAAYTWFNRFCALRFMDVNRYNRIAIVSAIEGQSQPEILAEAKMGHIDEDDIEAVSATKVRDLLGGKLPSTDPQTEAYRTLLVASCNSLHRLMPFLFARIEDYTELLLPDDLLSDNAVLTKACAVLTAENCQNVEVIGWLYQFYISEKKDDVFAALKKGKKITPENIPAATQLFTPHWIVRYLVENSLGRLWMLNNPESKLVDQMDYYIKPEEPETDFLKISSPEEIKISDPACGSGHMLTYAFDLLYAIYEEQGYQATDIPRLILSRNLYGIEIDQRAGSLAAFALTMKAREKYRRFLSSDKVVQPNICVLENIKIDNDELSSYMDQVGRDLFTQPLEDTLNQWEEADNFGSLIRPEVADVSEVLELLRERQIGEDLFLAGVHQKVLTALRQADYLNSKYHIVVANPPYMASKGMTPEVKSLLSKEFEAGKSDLFAAFILRCSEMSLAKAGIVSPYVWMFIASFKELRQHLIIETNLESLVQLEYNAFEPACIPVCAFVLGRGKFRNQTGVFIKLSEFTGHENQGPKTLEAINDPNCSWRFEVEASEFASIPGTPFAFWADKEVFKSFVDGAQLSELVDARIALATADNDRFIRFWHEVGYANIGFGIVNEEMSVQSAKKWFPCNKGGDYRKWSGNTDRLVNWEDGGKEVRAFADPNTGRIRSHNYNGDFAFRESLTWSALTSSHFSIRYSPTGFMFVTPGSSAFQKSTVELRSIIAFLCSNVANHILGLLSATVNVEVGDVLRLPYIEPTEDVGTFADTAVEIALSDWNGQETSSGYSDHILLQNKTSQLSSACAELSKQNKTTFQALKDCEERINRIMIETYGLSASLTPEVENCHVTLTCNPAYRYDGDKSESELEALLLADTMREFISYAVGCMLGRYSLDKPGLILANQGETADDYRKLVSEPTFAPDVDNVIPLLDGDWFTDDISERFKEFLKVTFGTEHFDENLTFLENSLYPENLTGKKRKTIRDYFLKEFYNHHIKLYKKRPIYWLFSSSKGTFNALVYMHRYRSDTVSVVLNGYLREFQTKLRGKLEQLQHVADIGDASKAEKTKALKTIDTLNKQLKELEDYERDILFPLAQEQIEIDLDDGVKVNYNKFGSALKKVTGLTGKV